jgi:hypothetical protein
MDTFGEVGERVREHDRSLQHAVRLDPMGDVDDLDFGCDPLHHAVANAHEVVLEPEVGQERDQHVPTLTRRQEHRVYEAVKVVSARLLKDSNPRLFCRSGRFRTDRYRRNAEVEIPVGSSSRRRGEDDQIAVNWLLWADSLRAIERNEVRAEVIHQEASRIFRPGKEDATRWSRKLGKQPLLCRNRGDEVNLPAPSFSGRFSNRSDSRDIAYKALAQFLGAPHAREDNPVIRAHINWSCLDRFELNQGSNDDSKPERPQAPNKLLRAPRGPRDDDRQLLADATSSIAKAAGSLPARRSIQAPSGSATRAVSTRPS